MKIKLVILSSLCIILSLPTFAQGPNRTFGKFKKLKDPSEITADAGYATIMLAYEKGTYINTVKAAIGLDDKFAIATDKGCYIEIHIPAGEHKVMLAQGTDQGGTIHNLEKCDCENDDFICLCSMFSNMGNYQIALKNDITDLLYNLSAPPYTNAIFSYVKYLTYSRNFKEGETYYYKTLRLDNGASLQCGPIVSETTKADFNNSINSKKIKEKGEPYFYEGKAD